MSKGIIPIALTIVGCAATVGAVILAVYETPDAIKTLDDHRLDIDPTGQTDLTRKEKAIDYAKSYKKTIACTSLSIACNIGACIIMGKNYGLLLKSSAATAALGSAYTSKYRSKIKKLIGEEKEKFIDSQVRKEIHDEYNDTVWFYEPETKTSFKASLKTVEEQYIDCLLALGRSETRTLGELFPQLKYAIDKNDPMRHKLDLVWHQEVIWDYYDQLLPEIIFEKVNFKDGSENTYEDDPNMNNGEPTYIIRYVEGPEPPETIMTLDC